MMAASEEINAEVSAVASEKTRADGTPYRSLSVLSTQALSERLSLPVREVEISALTQNVIPERYSRNFDSLSVAEQIKLLRTKIAVVGLGGLGGFVVETLARIGVGTMVIMDGDRYEDSNLNRQLVCTHAVLSWEKSAAVSRRIADINPAVTVTDCSGFLTEENAKDRISGVHVVADCLDNIPDRFLLQRAAAENAVPLVSAAVAGWSGQITTIYPGDKGLINIYGPPETAPGKGVETGLGNLPFTVSLLANLQCAEIVKVVLGKDGVLRNRLMIVDLADHTFDVLQLE